MKNVFKKFENKEILITGGAGFIGSQLAKKIIENVVQPKITIFDSLKNQKKLSNGNKITLGNKSNLPVSDSVNFVDGDLTEPKDLDRLLENDYDFIFHQAAISDTTASEEDNILYQKINVISFEKFLEYACKKNIPLVYASSASVYGDLKSPQEVGNENPLNIYAKSKLKMEKLAHQFNEIYKPKTLIGLRYFNVYGPGETYKGSTSSMILQLRNQILEGAEPSLFRDSDKIFRDFVYIDDVITANLLSSSTSFQGVLNVGSGEKRTFVEVAEILMNCLKIKKKIYYMENPYRNYQNDTCANISKTKKILGFEPFYNLESGIDTYMKSF